MEILVRQSTYAVVPIIHTLCIRRLSLRIEIELGKDQDLRSDEGKDLLDAALLYVTKLTKNPNTEPSVLEDCKFKHKDWCVSTWENLVLIAFQH